MVTPPGTRGRCGAHGRLHADGLVLVALAFHHKDLLSRNCHHINEVFQDDCGHTGHTGEARLCVAETCACVLPDMRLKGGSGDPGKRKRLAVRTICIITAAVCSSFSSSPAD